MRMERARGGGGGVAAGEEVREVVGEMRYDIVCVGRKELQPKPLGGVFESHTFHTFHSFHTGWRCWVCLRRSPRCPTTS